jgi:hypothetical protein
MGENKLYSVVVDFHDTTEIVVLASDENEAEEIACRSADCDELDRIAHATLVKNLDDLERLDCENDVPYAGRSGGNPEGLTCKEILLPTPPTPDPPGGEEYYCSTVGNKRLKVKGWRVVGWLNTLPM